jgi:hypothetical protein
MLPGRWVYRRYQAGRRAIVTSYSQDLKVWKVRRTKNRERKQRSLDKSKGTFNFTFFLFFLGACHNNQGHPLIIKSITRGFACTFEV